MALRFADRMEEVKASEIRELLKITERPEVISFAGGTPAPELFPVLELAEVTDRVLKKDGRQALQYATTEGFIPLREQIAERMNSKFRTKVRYENILITSGAQQGLDITGKVFLDKGDVVLCESPTYLGAINAFRAYGPDFIEVPTDQNGMIVGELEDILRTVERVKFIYVVPDFQNPTGVTWSIDRREKFMELINKYEVPVIEDNPYGELIFDGSILPSLKSMDQKGLVVFLGTFSKTFCPGLRVGWVAAEDEIFEKYILVKQGADLHTSIMNQKSISKYIEMYGLDSNVDRIKKVYKNRRDLMIKTIEEEFPDGIRFTIPGGGLFIWVELPYYMDAGELLKRSLKQNVAFVAGAPFFPREEKRNYLRLNYSNMPEEKIVEGIRRLGKVLRDELVWHNKANGC